MDTSNPDKIDANLNLGMCTAKQQHCTIQPQILPNLLDHSMKKETEDKNEIEQESENKYSNADVVIGALLGSVDGKMIDISNSFPLTLKIKNNSGKKDPEYTFDTELLKKMLKFYKGVNEFELLLGVYISSTNLDKQALIIIQYFLKLFTSKEVKS